MTRKGGNLFGLEYDTYWQIMNLTRHLNILSYRYRTKTDPLTGNQLGVQRQPVPMFPLIFTFGVKFELILRLSFTGLLLNGILLFMIQII